MIVRQGGRIKAFSSDGNSSAPTGSPMPSSVITHARDAFIDEGVPLLERLLQGSSSTTPFVLLIQNARASALVIAAAAILKRVCVLVPLSRATTLVPYVAEYTGISLVINPETNQVSHHHVVPSTTTPRDAWLQHSQVQDRGGVCMLTSGSTGLPKIVFCTWTSMFLQGQATHELLFPQGPSRVVCASSIAHAYAINALFAIYMSPYGHLCELHLDIHVEAIRLPFSCTSTPCPTILYGTPGTFTKLTTLDTTSSACSLSHVMAFSAGTVLPLDLRHALRDKFGLTVLQNYGSTETGGIATELLTTASTNPFGGSLQAVGQLWQGSQVHIAVPTNPCRLLDGEERGEILVLTPWQCVGYVEHGTLSPISRTGFYHTGDGGDMTNDGILYVGHRLRDPIHVRSQGMDVFVPPQQVERAILNNPLVTDVLLPLLIEVPSKVGYVKPVALVVAPTSTLDELMAWCTAHLPTMLQDLDIRLVEYLPCSPAGKLMYSLHVD